MAVSARGRRLAGRAKQLQADLLPSIDAHNFLCQTQTQRDRCCLNANPNAAGRLYWHPRLKVSHGVVAGGEAPRFIVNHIRRCRGPPRLSVLDRFDAHGEGACLKRYTNPSFFKTDSACSAKLDQACAPLRPNGCLKTVETRPAEFQSRDIHSKPPDSAHTDDCNKSESDASEKASLGFLSMLRQLKHRQTAGSVSPALKLPMQQSCIHKYESSAERRDSSADYSETGMSFTSSPRFDMEMDKANENHRGTIGESIGSPTSNCCSDAGSDYVGNCGELERTSSFEAWLSPCARFSTHEYETTDESSHHTRSRFVSHAVTSDGPFTDTMKAKQDSAAAETSCRKGLSRRHRYKGSIEMIASTVSSLPRKLCMKQQHDPLADSSCSHHAGGLRSNGITEAFLPVLVADPVFSIQDSMPESEESYSHQETIKLQRTGCPSYDASVDAEIHDQQNGPSISNHCSNISSPENCGDPTYTTDSKDVLLPRMQRTGCMIDGSLHNIKATSVLPENSCSQDTKADTPPPLPIPPMQWLSDKVHTGPITYRKPFRNDPVQRAGGKILKTTELSELAVNSYEAWSGPAGTNQQTGAEIHSQQEPRQQLAAEDSDKDMQVPNRPTEKLDQVFYRKGPEISSSHGNTLSGSEENKHSNVTRVDVQNSDSYQGDEGNLHHENVFFTAMEQLARMSPPWVPRPKHPLSEVVSHDRVTLRNGPSPIHGSRSILDSRTALLGQVKDKSFSLKPVSGTSSPASVTGSPTNARVATILQRADDMRQAHTDSNDVDGEDSWSDHSD